MNTITLWIEATRPKTLFASFSPVLIGTLYAIHQGSFSFMTAFFTLLATLGVQIGTNFVNDYYDFLKGADTSLRKGPRRLIQAGIISLEDMKLATLLTFSAVALLSIYLIARGGPMFAVLTAVSIFLGVGYTGGPWPLAYLGLGEVFVLFFFGPIATASTAYLQTLHFSWESFFLGFSPGFLSTAILVTNNLRDIEEDRKANKKTLAVRFGKRFTQLEYTICLVAGCLIPLYFGWWLSAFALIPALIPLRTIWYFRQETELNRALIQTGKVGFLTAVLISFALLMKSSLVYAF